MAKRPVLKTITAGHASNTQLDFNFDALADAIENQVSLDGSAPNAMTADFDLNSNDLLNGGAAAVTSLTIQGVALTAGANASTLVTQSVDGLMRATDKTKLDTWTSGTGTPESVVTAPVGSLFTRTDGGANTTLYVKESGTGNTGWAAK